MNVHAPLSSATDAVALLYAGASEANNFAIMEKLRASFLKGPRDASLADHMGKLIANAVQREDTELPPSFENRGRGSGLVLIGPTGVGKSKSLERYFKQHPVLRGYEDSASSSPLLSVEVPSPCTSVQLARALLRATGYSLERDLPAHRLWEKAFDRVWQMRKFIVHFDEMQHVVHNMPEKDLQQMADTLKNAMYARRITIVLSGVATLEPFIHHDPQLFRRLTIVPFKGITPDKHDEIRKMIVTYVAAAGLKAIDKSDLDTDDFISRLSHAALNAYGYSIVLTHLAIENALQRGHDRLAVEHFSTIFIAKTGFTAERNPFKARLVQDRLLEDVREAGRVAAGVCDQSQTEGQKVMVLPLGLTLPFMEDEPTTYFASRLAARNFLKARPFAADMGFSYSALDRGCEVAISRLSEISGVSVVALAANASHRVDEWLHLRGQLIDPKSRRNSQLVVCPACLEADIARGDFAPSIGIRGRLSWTLKSIRTCVVHGMALVNIPQNDQMPLRHDWSQLVAPVLPQIKSLTDSATRRPPSKLEGYLINRLQGNAAECWLNSLEFHAAEHMAQVFGSAALYGDKVALNLSDDEKYAAGDVGFDIVEDGPKGIPEFLSRMQSEFVRRDRTAGAASVYGRIYARLTFLAEDPAFASVHDIVSDHIMSSFPVGPGDMIFRKPVTTRRYHSVLTLSKQFKCRESRIEKVLRLEGLLPDRHDSGRDVLLEADRAEQLIEREMQSLTLAEAERRLGASANVMKILLDGGFVQRRRVSKGPHGLRFWADELDAFLARVLEGTEPIEGKVEETMSISYASAHARCTISTIFQFILGRKLRWVGRRTDRSGLDALLVNPEDLKLALNRPTDDGLSAIDAAESLRLAPAVMRRLADRKIVGSFSVSDPMTGHEKLRFARAEIDRFASEYISLFNLGRTLGQKAARVRKDLDARGVKPAQELLGLDAIFYRRSDLETQR